MNVNAIIPKVDFEVLPIEDIASIYILDTSDWKHLKGQSTPYIEIKVPGSKKYVGNLINMNELKIFRSDALGLSSKKEINQLYDLPDGIYWINLSICKGNLDICNEKMYLRFNCLQKEIDKKANQINPTDKDAMEALKDIYVKREIMESSARCGNASRAMNFYERIQEKLKYIK